MADSPHEVVLAWWAERPDLSAPKVAAFFAGDEGRAMLPDGATPPKPGTVRSWKSRHGMPEARKPEARPKRGSGKRSKRTGPAVKLHVVGKGGRRSAPDDEEDDALGFGDAVVADRAAKIEHLVGSEIAHALCGLEKSPVTVDQIEIG